MARHTVRFAELLPGSHCHRIWKERNGRRYRVATFTLYRAKDGWRWQVRAGNGRIVAAATEAYRRKRDAWHNVRMTAQALWDVTLPAAQR